MQCTNYGFESEVMLTQWHVEGLCPNFKHLSQRDKFIMSAKGDICEIATKIFREQP